MAAPLLPNKILLITGAGGIAAATAIAAAREGASVFIVSLDAQQCDELASAVSQIGAACEAFAADLTDESAVAAAISRCVGRFGRIDALYNVAGISGRRLGDGPIHQCTTEGWQATLDANLKSVFLTCRQVIGVMMSQEPASSGLRGTILNMASVLAFSPRADHFATHAYAASKGAIISLSEAMAAYYAPHKIRVNAIAPGLVRTPMSRRAQEDPAIIELLKSKQPLTEEFLSAEDIAASSVFLLSDQAKSITGITMTVDGGWCVSG